MYYCGICSISFRSLSPEEIMEAAVDAGLDGIEWGSDVHVLPGAVTEAKRITGLMKAKGLRNLSYGTYFGVDQLELDKLADYLKTAQALETDIIRIWAPTKRRTELTNQEYAVYVDFMKKVADQAADYGITVCFECHHHTLVEDPQDAVQYLKDINRSNVKMYWQPNQFLSCDENVAAAKILCDYVENVHVFHWQGMDRFPLWMGLDDWMRYKQALEADARRDRAYLLEFMHDDAIASLKSSADALQEIVKSVCCWN